MSAFSQLNLRPQERRLLFVVLAVVFVVVNIFFVWPRFGAWDETARAIDESRKKREAYQTEIDRIPRYQQRIRELEGQGSAVVPEEQALQLLRIVQQKAQEHRVAITQTRAVATSAVVSTNTFFDEQAITVGVNTGAPELVSFLYAIGSDDSMIRIRDLDLRAEPPNQYRLVGNVTLVASYQKRTRTATGPRRSPDANPIAP